MHNRSNKRTEPAAVDGIPHCQLPRVFLAKFFRLQPRDSAILASAITSPNRVSPGGPQADRPGLSDRLRGVLRVTRRRTTRCPPAWLGPNLFKRVRDSPCSFPDRLQKHIIWHRHDHSKPGAQLGRHEPRELLLDEVSQLEMLGGRLRTCLLLICTSTGRPGKKKKKNTADEDNLKAGKPELTRRGNFFILWEDGPPQLTLSVYPVRLVPGEQRIVHLRGNPALGISQASSGRRQTMGRPDVVSAHVSNSNRSIWCFGGTGLTSERPDPGTPAAHSPDGCGR
jgi:hypothetical protein